MTDLGFELVVLGAGPAYTDRPGSIGASYLLRSGDDAIVLDLGQGAFPALAGAIEPSSLCAIVVSHLHPDHFIDLVALRHYLRWEFEPSRRVRVLAPAGIGGRLDALHGEPGWTAAALDAEPLSEGSRRIGPFEVEARLVTHTAESYGFRVSLAGGAGADDSAGDDPPSNDPPSNDPPSNDPPSNDPPSNDPPGNDPPGLVYSGDCGRADDLAPLIRPGDWLLTEISFGAGPAQPGAEHLDGPAVGDLARATAPGRVLLTHLQMGYDPDQALASVRARYGGPVEFVSPGSRFG